MRSFPGAWSAWRRAYSQRGLVTLAATADLPEDANVETLAWRLACQESLGDFVFDLFGSGFYFSNAATEILGNCESQSCRHAGFNPLQFNYTLAIVSNASSNSITDVSVNFTEPPEATVAVLDYSNSFNQLCDFLPWEVGGLGLVEARHRCSLNLVSDIQELPSDARRSVTKGVSVIRPGERIVFLLNAYVPDETGLPGTYILDHTHIHGIKYREAGHVFEILNPKPLASDRLGIIRSPSGGMGGQ